jgi:hypothetical protein
MVVTVRPITEVDLRPVGEYLAAAWPRQRTTEGWMRQVSPPWDAAAPNHGFMLVDGDQIVGAYLAVYADRLVDGRCERFCNLATWYVEPDHRLHSLRLLKALLDQDGYHFTDLTAGPEVKRINERFGFVPLDTTCAVIPNLPYPTRPGRHLVSSSPAVIEEWLTGDDLAVYRHHAASTAAEHVVLVSDGQPCHVMVRKLGRHAYVLYVSDRTMFQEMVRPLARHLLLHGGYIATLAELRVVGGQPPLSRIKPLKGHRRMYRSSTLRPDQIDYLYSEFSWRG